MLVSQTWLSFSLSSSWSQHTTPPENRLASGRRIFSELLCHHALLSSPFNFFLSFVSFLIFYLIFLPFFSFTALGGNPFWVTMQSLAKWYPCLTPSHPFTTWKSQGNSLPEEKPRQPSPTLRHWKQCFGYVYTLFIPKSLKVVNNAI